MLTLDEPERRNALTAGLVKEIVAAVGEIEGDDGVGARVVTGAPPAVFAGGAVGRQGALNGGGGGDAPPSARD